MEPITIQGTHLLSIDLLTFQSFKCDLIEDGGKTNYSK